MSKRRKPIILVGGGAPDSFFGAVHQLAAGHFGAFDVVAGVLSRDPELSRQYGDRFGFAKDRRYGDLDELIEGESSREDGARAAIICVPNAHHYLPYGKRFAEAGWAVMTDKPITASITDARDWNRDVEAAGTPVAVSHTYTGYPMMRFARSMIAADEIGQIVSVESTYFQDWLGTALEADGQRQAQWRTTPEIAGFGAAGDIGSHAYFDACWLTGRRGVVVINASLRTIVRGRGIDDDFRANVMLEGDIPLHVVASQVAAGHGNNHSIQVIGTEASLYWTHERHEELEIRRGGRREILTRDPNAPWAKGSVAIAGASHLPGGHPEAFHAALANIYDGLATWIEDWEAAGRTSVPAPEFIPTLADGTHVQEFLHSCSVSSADSGSAIPIAKH